MARKHVREKQEDRPTSDKQEPLVGRVMPRKGRGPAQPKAQEYGPLSLLSMAELSRVLNLSPSTLKKLRRHPSFPKRRQLPGGPKGWLYGEIEKFILNSPIAEPEEKEGGEKE